MPAVLRFQHGSRPPVRHPASVAALTALLYIGLCSLYIVASGWLASSLATSTQQLAAIERMKGIAFVCVTGAIFFGVSYMRLRQIQRQEQTIIKQEEALLLSESKVVAAMCAATLAHDLNNLLVVLHGMVRELRGKEQGDAFIASLREELERGTASLAQMARRIASAARQALPEGETDVNLQEAVTRLAHLVWKHPDVRGSALEIGALPAVTLRLNTVLFEEAILNLLLNAGQAAGPGGRVAVQARENEDAVILEVHDSGPGVAPGDVEAIFAPCFTTKPNGTGLGLIAVKAFAASCKGEVIVDRSYLGGAVFSLRIPKTA